MIHKVPNDSACLGSCLTSMMERKYLIAFSRKTPSYMFDRVPNTPVVVVFNFQTILQYSKIGNCSFI